MSRFRLVFVLLLVTIACFTAGTRLCAETPPAYIIEQDWEWATDGAYIWEMDFNANGLVYNVSGGEYGSQAIETDIIQTIRNRTQSQWTGWHVDITNGTLSNIENIVVKNLQAPQLDWAVEPYASGKGFFAHIYPGNDTQVDYLEQLYISFSYTVDDDTQQVAIRQYPTTTNAVPEPASIAGIMMGLMGMGFGIRRKK